MKQEFQILLNGLGFYELTRKRRRTLSIILVSVLTAHVVGLAIFGGAIVMRAMRSEETVFVAPPPIKTYEPRKLEHRVKVQKRQRSSSRPSMVPRMVSMKPSNLALPEIRMDPKLVHTSFQPKFKAVSGKGLGAGLGTGYGLGGFGSGVSSFDFFGIKGRGDKIAVLVDVSVSMVEEERGGPDGFDRVKARINKVVDALSESALFNLIVFADVADALADKLMIGSDQNKSKAKSYILPFNTPGNWGLTHGNVRAANMGVAALGGTTRLDLALTAAFNDGADTILIISDGLPRVKKGWTEEQRLAHAQMVRDWHEAHQAEIRAWQAANANVGYTEEKVWVAPQPAVPARPPSKRPLKEDQAPDRGSPAIPARAGYWTTVRHRTDDIGPRPQPPGLGDPGYWTLTDFCKHLEALHTKLYKQKGKPPPVIHAIGYAIDKEGGDFLKALTHRYKGRYRWVARIK